ncbi:MAG: hypothetical protein IPI04_18645 [Ignavibacteria bacterium]|nr:hypothetical protein [Ignavibacteria bacterium]
MHGAGECKEVWGRNRRILKEQAYSVIREWLMQSVKRINSIGYNNIIYIYDINTKKKHEGLEIIPFT